MLEEKTTNIYRIEMKNARLFFSLLKRNKKLAGAVFDIFHIMNFILYVSLAVPDPISTKYQILDIITACYKQLYCKKNSKKGDGCKNEMQNERLRLLQ